MGLASTMFRSGLYCVHEAVDQVINVAGDSCSVCYWNVYGEVGGGRLRKRGCAG